MLSILIDIRGPEFLPSNFEGSHWTEGLDQHLLRVKCLGKPSHSRRFFRGMPAGRFFRRVSFVHAGWGLCRFL